jgi:hypothetical protein
LRTVCARRHGTRRVSGPGKSARSNLKRARMVTGSISPPTTHRRIRAHNALRVKLQVGGLTACFARKIQRWLFSGSCNYSTMAPGCQVSPSVFFPCSPFFPTTRAGRLEPDNPTAPRTPRSWGRRANRAADIVGRRSGTTTGAYSGPGWYGNDKLLFLRRLQLFRPGFSRQSHSLPEISNGRSPTQQVESPAAQDEDP